MFTVCPKCTLTLAVTAGDLRTGQGYVRCGRCSNVFNALLTLTEQPPEVTASPTPAPAAPPSAQSVKAPAAPASERTPASEVASSIQIDQILMLGGSAFPRPQAASPQRAASPAPQRRANPAPTPATARAPRADAAEVASRASPMQRGPAMRARAAPPQAAANTGGSAEVQAPADRADANHPLPPARGMREPPPPVPSKPTVATSPAVSVTPPKRPQPNTPSAEESEESTTDEAELIERSGSEGIEGRTVETIVLEGDGFTQTEEFVSEEQAELAALRREIESLGDERSGSGAATPGARAAESAPDSGATVRRVRSFRLPRRGSAQAELSDVGSDAERSAQPAEAASAMPFALDAQSLRYRWAWLSGSIVLAVLLSVQVIDHWREALAASPSLSSIVTRAYAALGVTLEPHWDLTAYEVRQQGAEADPKDAHVIHVRLSLANHAPRAQPVPVLRLTLLDRYGKRIARRDLAPNEYWPRGRTHQSFLSADQRIDSEVAVRDPNADSASFELDVCLRGGEQMHCAMDTAPATANILTP